MDKNINISNKLLKIREEKRMSQSEFSEQLGVKQSYYSELERGKRELTTRVLINLMEIFHISADMLLSDKADFALPQNIPAYHSKLIEDNNEKLTNYYLNTELNSDYQDYKQIWFYDSYTPQRLKDLISIRRHEFKGAYESEKRLIDLLHYLNPEHNSLTKKFRPLPDFETYFKKNESEFKEDIIEAQIEDIKLIKILQLMRYDEEYEYWNSQIVRLTTYLHSSKDLILVMAKKYGVTSLEKESEE